MRQLAQYQDGRLELQEVPRPQAPPGGILVRTTHSVISVGTEKMKVEQAKMNLLRKARARPDQVRKVMDTARTLGWKNALEKVRNRLETPTPMGYSSAGIVEEVDEANTRFRVGDRVACGGAECAFHAEYVALPDLLAAPVPEGVQNWQAAYTTIASIALQAVRQLNAGLGDRILVMGQGLVGLLVTNLLAESGVRVMALDVADSRRAFAEALGAERVVITGRQDLMDEVRLWTEGFGVDGVVLCTGTQSNAPIEQAIQAIRDRGRMVDVGNTRLDLAWKDFYAKEVELVFSRSYGPGRYDPSYEWGGHDYPIGYVRWTEQRNFQACLNLMRKGRLRLEEITTRRVGFENCLVVYKELSAPGGSDLGVVMEYPGAGDFTPPVVSERINMEANAANDVAVRVHPRVEQVDVVGAGNFAKTMLLPHLSGKIQLGTVVNQTSLSANHVKTKFGFYTASTNQQDALSADASAALLIATRHHLHAKLVTAGLRAGRHVFVEKPLCMTREELSEIDEAAAGSGTVLVGFNRRFAPASVELRELMNSVPGAKTASFRVLAGKLDPEHWYANHLESGGRVLGEACHFLDYFCFLFAAAPVRVSAQPVGRAGGRLPFPDSAAGQIEFADGSCGQLIYSAEGAPGYPKESLTVHGAGFVAELTNFQELVIHRNRKKRRTTHGSKGHREEMEAWLSFLTGRTTHPLPYAESRRSMLVTFGFLESIRTGRAITI